MKRPTAKGKGEDIYFQGEKKLDKGKASFYFDQNFLDDLDQTWMQLRMENRKLTKSDFVQAALEEMIREYQQRKEESRLYQRLIAPLK